MESFFYSQIRFPGDINPEYTRLIKNTAPAILKEYEVEVKPPLVSVTVQVINALFRKLKQEKSNE